MKVVILGKQGSGKSTQGELISRYFSIPHLDVGRVLREKAKKKNKLGKTIRKFMLKGLLLPDKLIGKIIRAELKKIGKGFVLDGFPRNLDQAKMLKDVDIALLLKIPDKIALKRLISRRVCSKCGEVYNLLSKKPKKDAICDKCRGKVVRRDDDNELVIKKRLNIYKKEIKPVINFYKKRKLLVAVNAEKPVEKIFEQISLILSKPE